MRAPVFDPTSSAIRCPVLLVVTCRVARVPRQVGHRRWSTVVFFFIVATTLHPLSLEALKLAWEQSKAALGSLCVGVKAASISFDEQSLAHLLLAVSVLLLVPLALNNNMAPCGVRTQRSNCDSDFAIAITFQWSQKRRSVSTTHNDCESQSCLPSFL